MAMSNVHVIDDVNQSGKKLFDELITQSNLYRNGADLKELYDFIVRIRNFAPFNAMMINIQRPDLVYAEYQASWEKNFKRGIKRGARPLIIMWSFGPIALVYDLNDTEGKPIPPKLLEPLIAEDYVNQNAMDSYFTLLGHEGINVVTPNLFQCDEGDIRMLPDHNTLAIYQAKNKKQKGKKTTVKKSEYQIRLNNQLSSKVQFATLIHELAHLFLGHLGIDTVLDIKDRKFISHDMREIEAESICYIICNRYGVKPNSDDYLGKLISNELPIKWLNLHTILTVAGRIEKMLNLGNRTTFKKYRDTTRIKVTKKPLVEYVDLKKAKKINQYYFGAPHACDFCKTSFADEEYLVDGALQGSEGWADMCESCFDSKGKGISHGVGQLYLKQQNGKWLLVGGFGK